MFTITKVQRYVIHKQCDCISPTTSSQGPPYKHTQARTEGQTSTVSAQLFSPSDGVLNVEHTSAQIRVPTLDIQLLHRSRPAPSKPPFPHTLTLPGDLWTNSRLQ